ncbi:unnamed protein product [Fusarium fujikuroi]|uniref:Enoyl reductase (ER) domain-containing protein n=1 Tax=Fusarium fujikuroi TaxID=5127 RepID=A0A9Q9UI32_FUSFU|nr:unnamed protein product [Fusarium fujikuroi]VTT81272.1 unnamed protein product [Fusarium fujikuroi]VZH94195.1 unnamed protein product [Fusarium fujikuroi]
MPSNNAAWLVAAKTSPLEVKEAPLTEPSSGHILVKNSAIAINPVDIANQYVGIFIQPSQYPVILGEDVAGTVEAVGPDVTIFKPGDRVLGYATSLATKDNAHSAFQEYTIIRAECASKIPERLSFEQAAVLPLSLATAAWSLFGDVTLAMRYPSLNPTPTEETVLIWGGSSSVGGSAVQLAKAAGYEVITTASAKNHDYVKSLGADHVFEYKSPQVTKDIASLLTGKKLAGAFDASGSEDGMNSASQSIVHADGLRKLICVRSVSSEVAGVEAKTILSTSIINTPVAKAVFGDYIPAALEQGKFKAVPEAEVVGKGLEAVQLGINTLAKGVSAKKIVEIIALIGLGTIGLSFAALHLRYSNANLRLYDVRSDLKEHIESLLPVYLESTKKENSQNDLTVEKLVADGRLLVCSSIEEVCSGATIVQEQGPDSVDFKKSNWAQVIKYAPSNAHLWSSTSGISASRQVEDLENKTRVLVVHPFNPPHIMPLIEVVPSPHTDPERTQFAIDYFKNLGSGHRPVRINKETQGFVGNRLAFALFREACHLVSNDVVSVEDLDTIVEASIAPRWAVAGPFKTYNSAGGTGGIGAFLHNLADTMEACWDDAGDISLKGTSATKASQGTDDGDWTDKITKETEQAYGRPTAESLAQRDRNLQKVISAQPKVD